MSAPTIYDYHATLAENTNGHSVMLWKTIKSFVYSFLFIAVGYQALRYGAPPLETMGMVIGAMIIAMVGEIKEVEIASLVTLNFRQKHARDDAEDD